MLSDIASEIQPTIEMYAEKVFSCEKQQWEDEINGFNSRKPKKPINSIDSLEEDSIFSLGKIVMSPRYSQYPDLSDDEENQSCNALSLPTIRPVPFSAPPTRIIQRPLNNAQFNPR